MEKVRQWLRRWLGINDLDSFSDAVAREAAIRGELLQKFSSTQIPYINRLEEKIEALQGRIEDLEAAYPDYKKAKAEADERKGKEIVPGFRPFSQRKREWEASRRKQPEKK